MRAVIYCRCSTEEECQRDALLRQAAEARECVRRLNWSLEDEYIESRSGTSTRGREQYQRLFADLLRDRFEIVVIKSQDRLMRNTRDWYIFIDRLVTSGKQLYLYLENRFYNTDDALITGIKAILAEEYSRELSRKINNAHRNRQKTGSALMLTSNTYGFWKMPDKSLVLVEEEAAVKRKMYELCAAGLGSRRISRILLEEGIRKRNGNPFSDSDIRRMIRNPINKGTVVMNRKHYDFDTRKTVKNPEEQFFIYEKCIPAIVPEELWEAANREIDRRRNIPEERENVEYGRNKGKYTLSGKLVCGLCGAPFYRTTRRRKKDLVHEWKCRTYLEQGRKKEGRTGGCENIHLKEPVLFSVLENMDLEEHVFFAKANSSLRLSAESGSSLSEPVLIEVFVQILKDYLEEQEKSARKNLEQTEKKINHQQRLLLDKYLEGIIEEPAFREKQYELQRKLEKSIRKPMGYAEKHGQNLVQNNGVPDRPGQIRQFLEQDHSISKACTLCLLEEIEKIWVYPDRLELVQKGGKSIIAVKISDMLY